MNNKEDRRMAAFIFSSAPSRAGAQRLSTTRIAISNAVLAADFAGLLAWRQFTPATFPQRCPSHNA
jgi:hypothetical protein